jgi:hypothetical protein
LAPTGTGAAKQFYRQSGSILFGSREARSARRILYHTKVGLVNEEICDLRFAICDLKTGLEPLKRKSHIENRKLPRFTFCGKILVQFDPSEHPTLDRIKKTRVPNPDHRYGH